MKKNFLFKNLTPKVVDFYWNENKVPQVAQKDFLVVKTKIRTKNWGKFKKKLPKSD